MIITFDTYVGLPPDYTPPHCGSVVTYDNMGRLIYDNTTFIISHGSVSVNFEGWIDTLLITHKQLLEWIEEFPDDVRSQFERKLYEFM